MSKISIVDLELFVNVGVSDQERSKPQRILLTVDMAYDFSSAAISDKVIRTIDYFQVVQNILKYMQHRNWRLIEKLATDVANMVLSDFSPQSVSVEVKKFVIPQAAYVSVSLTKSA